MLLAMVAAMGCEFVTPPVREAAHRSERRQATNVDSARWRGFNLLGMFQKGGIESAFREDDFKWIREFGFNFVRLPLDYRIWTDEHDGTRIDEEQLKRVDEAVGWGEKYELHVCLNLHRAPGYTVASPPEATNLWTDAAAQEAFLHQWMMLAARYKARPSTALSFNLLNEPAGVDAATYETLVRVVSQAIWKIDPKRPIVVDGLAYGEEPLPGLRDLPLIQATRGYAPRQLTHWDPQKTDFPIPEWPMPKINRLLFGSEKSALKSPLRIEGSFPVSSKLTLHVLQVSTRASLEIKANGAPVWKKSFVPGPGKGEWKDVVFKPEWSIYQNNYGRDYEVELPAGTNVIEIAVEDGDWLSFSSVTIASAIDGARGVRLAATTEDFQARQSAVYLTPQGTVDGTRTILFDRAWLERGLTPWRDAERNAGLRVFVGEFGAYAKTPHAVVLSWMEDELAVWKKARWGWALWNFRGEFGVLDSARADVAYEPFRGHQLDRKMLTLLQRYLP